METTQTKGAHTIIAILGSDYGFECLYLKKEILELAICEVYVICKVLIQEESCAHSLRAKKLYAYTNTSNNRLFTRLWVKPSESVASAAVMKYGAIKLEIKTEVICPRFRSPGDVHQR